MGKHALRMTDVQVERFWRKVRRTEQCWLWTAALDSKLQEGKVNINYHGVLAKCVAWELITGDPPPYGLHATVCANRLCVRPSHMNAWPQSWTEPALDSARFEPVAARIEFATQVRETAGSLATPCHEWTGSRNSHGYGYFRRDSAHRWAWRFAHGAVPPGLFVCHHCDNPSCVRPDHLFVGSQADNMQDAARKGRIRNRFTGPIRIE